MDSVDYARLAAPLDGDSPSGADPEYDPVFLELEKLLRPSAPGMVAEAPDAEEAPVDYAGAREQAEGLAETTRDIRLAMRLARLSLLDPGRSGGFPGFAAALDLAAELTENLWNDVHPQLDSEDDMDATMRLNAYGDLEDPRLLHAMLDVTVARAGRNSVTLRDLEVAVGKRDPREGEELNEVNGRVADIFNADPDDLQTASEAAARALDAVGRIRTAWTGAMDALAEARDAEGLQFENLPAPQMEALEARLNAVARLISDRMPNAPEEETEGEDGEVVAGGSARSGGSGVIASRQDADRQILKIIDWFRHNEPSSPVPALLERARSMISKSFLEIIDELGEGGITEARRAMNDGTNNEGEDA